MINLNKMKNRMLRMRRRRKRKRRRGDTGRLIPEK